MAKTPSSHAGGLGSLLVREFDPQATIKSTHMLQPEIRRAAVKTEDRVLQPGTRHGQVNFFFIFDKRVMPGQEHNTPHLPIM